MFLVVQLPPISPEAAFGSLCLFVLVMLAFAAARALCRHPGETSAMQIEILELEPDGEKKYKGRVKIGNKTYPFTASHTYTKVAYTSDVSVKIPGAPADYLHSAQSKIQYRIKDKR